MIISVCINPCVIFWGDGDNNVINKVYYRNEASCFDLGYDSYDYFDNYENSLTMIINET